MRWRALHHERGREGSAASGCEVQRTDPTEEADQRSTAMSLKDFTAPKQELKQLAAELLAFHSLAGKYPLMLGQEFDALVADIKANGLREKITLYESKVLDRVNRYRATLKAGVEPQFEPFEGTEADARAFVRSKNLHRRHLKPKEKRDRLVDLIQAQPEKSDRQIGEMAQVSKNTVKSVRDEMETRGQIDHVKTRTDTKGRQQPAKKKNKATKPAPVSADIEKIRNEAAARIRGLLGTNKPEGEAPLRQNSSGEIGDGRGADPGVEGGGNSHQDGGLEGDQDHHRDGGDSAVRDDKPRLAPNGETTLYCSFCGTGRDQVDILITDGSIKSPPVCICNECVDRCVSIISERKAAASPADDGLDIPDFLRRDALEQRAAGTLR